MADIKSFPNNSSEYVGAEWLMKWFHGRTSGVFGAEGNAVVEAVQGTMSVTVADGLGWLSNSNGDGIVWWNDVEEDTGEKLVLPIDMADGVRNRIDRIVVTWQTTNYVALPVIEVLKGAISSTPVPPALTNNTEKRQISLAQISVPAGITALTPVLITDERLNPEVCGIVTERIGIDTDDLYNKYMDALNQMRQAIEEAWSGEIPVGSVSREFAATISAAGWSGSDAPYTNTVTVVGLLASDTPIVDMIPSASFEAAEAEIEAYGMVYRMVASNDSLTVYATDKPEVDINIQMRSVRK